MENVPIPSVEQMAHELLVAADPGQELSPEGRTELARLVLPHTPAAKVRELVDGIHEHLWRSQFYAGADAGLAHHWFGDCIDSDKTAERFAETLRERAPVWRGEAETLALTAAMNDRTLYRSNLDAPIPYTTEGAPKQ